MSETNSVGTVSFSFEMRGELFGTMDLLYRDAGKGRAAFEAARSTPSGHSFEAEQRPETAQANDTDTPKYLTPRHMLPDPHPSFALPNRKLREESWFLETLPRKDGKPMAREEFMAARRDTDKSCSRDREREQERR